MSLSASTSASFLEKLKQIYQSNDINWLKIDLVQTSHMRLVLKLAKDSIKSDLPISQLVKSGKAYL